MADTDLTITPARSYLTIAEFKDAPTGLDPSSLISGGSGGQEDKELANVIARASSWIDRICHQVLAPTTDTERKRIRGGRFGQAWVMTDSFPIIRLSAFKYADDPSLGWTTANLTTSTVLVDERHLEVYCSLTPGLRYRAQYTYENGYANTTLASSAGAAGATSIAVTSALGIIAGLDLTIYDGANTETVTVASSYTIGSTTVPLLAATVNAHSTAGVAVSALPPVVKEAAILATSILIKVRGSDATILDDTLGTPSAGVPDGLSRRADTRSLVEMLRDFTVTVRQ